MLDSRGTVKLVAGERSSEHERTSISVGLLPMYAMEEEVVFACRSALDSSEATFFLMAALSDDPLAADMSCSSSYVVMPSAEAADGELRPEPRPDIAAVARMAEPSIRDHRSSAACYGPWNTVPLRAYNYREVPYLVPPSNFGRR
eukprot:SAG11_NODE_5461_length_1553_cov_1.691884_1_plen_145_part_00